MIKVFTVVVLTTAFIVSGLVGCRNAKGLEPEKVKCYDCKHYVDEEDAQAILHRDGEIRYFCPMHKKKYDRVIFNFEFVKVNNSTSYYKLTKEKFLKRIPENFVEVTEDGKEIK